MLSLTTWQRDLLHYLINTGEPVDTVAYSNQQHLTLRQIRYGLREIESWLERRQVLLVNTPKSGLQVVCTPDQRDKLLAELSSQTKFQLILTSEQRQQLLLLLLVVAQEPLTLQQLQQDLVISRMTVLKDLDSIESWLQKFSLELARRTHVGCWIEGEELARRQALAALLWGEVQYDQPVMSVQPLRGIIFTLSQDVALLPIVGQVNALVRGWNQENVENYIANAQTELGVRFTDEAITLISLALTVQVQRIGAGQLVAWKPDALNWIEAQSVWPVMHRVGSQLWPHLTETAFNSETVAMALQFLGNARDVPWPSKLRLDPIFHKLINRLMKSIAAAYAMPELAHDQMLYDGLEEAIRAARFLEGVEFVVVSMGREGALLVWQGQGWLAASPPIRERNPIGAGDSLVAGLVAGLSQGDPLEALRLGVACGAATASHNGTAIGTRLEIDALRSQVSIRKLAT